jgi:hypothetical protein
MEAGSHGGFDFVDWYIETNQIVRAVIIECATGAGRGANQLSVPAVTGERWRGAASENDDCWHTGCSGKVHESRFESQEQARRCYPRGGLGKGGTTA